MHFRRIAWQIALPIVGLLLLGLAAYNYWRMGRQEVVRLRCSGRNACAATSQLAQQIVADVRGAGIELELVAADNSTAICSAVDHHLIDIGVVLGGFPAGRFENVRQVAALGVEPLHLVVRRELAGDGAPTLDVLKGHRVYVGERGSNACDLVEDLLRYADFRFAGAVGGMNFAPVYRPEWELRDQVRNLPKLSGIERDELLGQLPEALFIGGSLPDPFIDCLIKSAGYRLAPLPFATALHLDRRREYGAQTNALEISRIEPTDIPAYTYGAAPAEPPQSYETIGLRLLLVANKHVPPATIHRLLRALADGADRDYHNDLTVASTSAEFPLHAGAETFTASQRPVSFSDAVQGTTNVLSMVGAFSAGTFALWSYFRGLRTVSPQFYLQQIDRIERLVRGVESEDAAPTAPIDLLVYLEARLAHLKQTVVDDYSRGRLKGDDALVSILTLIADTRNLLVQTHARLCRSNPSLSHGPYLDAA